MPQPAPDGDAELAQMLAREQQDETYLPGRFPTTSTQRSLMPKAKKQW